MQEEEMNLPEEDFGYEMDGQPEPDMEDGFDEGEADYDYEETAEPEAAAPSEPFLKVKYNHEERGLSQEEAVQLAQKGMNYDKLTEKLNQYENHPGLSYLSDLASRNDMSVDELVDYWRGQEEQTALNELIQQNIPEEYAREMLESRKFREAQQQKEQQAQQQELQNREFKEFFDTFPGTKPEEIPNEVWAANQQGVPLKYAFMEYQFQNINQQNQILRKNQENKKKAPGLGVTGFGSSEPTKSNDAFMDGFNSDY